MDDVLLAQINQAHGTTFRLLQRYAGGEQGAYALVDAAGGAFALKLSPDLATAAYWLRIAQQQLRRYAA